MQLSETQLIITRDELAAFCAHASTDTTRAHLASVCIDLSRGRVASTDGHRLLLWTDEKRGEREILLPAYGLRQVLAIKDQRVPRPLGAKRKGPPDKPSLTFVFGEKETRVNVAGLSVLLPHVTADYPPVESVIPKYKMGDPCSCVALNPASFADVERIAKVIDARIPSVVVQPGPTVLDPILLRFSRDPKWLVVLMPMHAGGTYDAVSKKVAA